MTIGGLFPNLACDKCLLINEQASPVSIFSQTQSSIAQWLELRHQRAADLSSPFLLPAPDWGEASRHAWASLAQIAVARLRASPATLVRWYVLCSVCPSCLDSWHFHCRRQNVSCHPKYILERLDQAAFLKEEQKLFENLDWHRDFKGLAGQFWFSA